MAVKMSVEMPVEMIVRQAAEFIVKKTVQMIAENVVQMPEQSHTLPGQMAILTTYNNADMQTC